MSSNRPERVAEAIRDDLSQMIARDVHDPGIGFLTLTRVKVTPDLQIARVYYTTLGDEQARRNTANGLARATPFLRRQLGQRLRLRRVPELEFFYDESIAHADRVEQILHELEEERAARAGADSGAHAAPAASPASSAASSDEHPDDE